MKKHYGFWKSMRRAPAFLAIFSLLTLGCKDDDDFWDAFIPETDEEPTSTQIEGYVFYPAVQKATDANIAQLKVPAGFAIN
jgi:hypothetical protein